MTRDKFKTNYPDDASGQLRGDLMNKLSRALNDIKPEREEAKRRRTDSDRIVNLSSTALVRGQVLQLGDTFNDRGAGADDITRTLSTDGLRPIFYEPCLVGVEPKGRVHEIAVLQENAAVGEVAECQLDGVCTAWVNITSKAHRFAKAVAGSHYLQSAMCGHARIYWSPNATGLQLCRVRLGPPQSIQLIARAVDGIAAADYQADTKIVPGSSSTVELWAWNSTMAWSTPIRTDPTNVASAILTETVYNYAPTAISDGRLLIIASDDDFRFNVIVEFCDDGFEAQSSGSSRSSGASTPSSVSSVSTASTSSCGGSSLSSPSSESSASSSTASSQSSASSSSQSSPSSPSISYTSVSSPSSSESSASSSSQSESTASSISSVSTPSSASASSQSESTVSTASSSSQSLSTESSQSPSSASSVSPSSISTPSSVSSLSTVSSVSSVSPSSVSSTSSLQQQSGISPGGPE